MAVVLKDLYKALNNSTVLVAGMTLHELTRLKRGVNTDFSRAMQWPRKLHISVKVVTQHNKTVQRAET